MMLDFFKSEYEARCSYCAQGRKLNDSELILCPVKGIMTMDSFCRKFKYDRFKRIPKRIPRLPEFDKSEFEI